MTMRGLIYRDSDSLIVGAYSTKALADGAVATGQTAVEWDMPDGSAVAAHDGWWWSTADSAPQNYPVDGRTDAQKLAAYAERAAKAIEFWDREFPRVVGWQAQSGLGLSASGTTVTVNADASTDTKDWMVSLFTAAAQVFETTNVTPAQGLLAAELCEELDNAQTVGQGLTPKLDAMLAWYLNYPSLATADNTNPDTPGAAGWRLWFNGNWCSLFLAKFISGLPGVVAAAAGSAPAYITLAPANTWRTVPFARIAARIRAVTF